MGIRIARPPPTQVPAPPEGSIQPVQVTNFVKTEIQPPSVQWRSLMRNTFLFLGVMHTFRIGTEQGTRDALGNNPFSGYLNAVGALHGWSDGDGYYVNYLGHPIEGAVSGYIWLNNDPRYRYVEFGRSRDYWMSRLRAYAFAWLLSEEFEIGPVSEASIGQIQRYCCAYGFVDHVITPNGGLFWMVAADAVDKYVVRKIEDRTRNRLARVLARGVLNPPLSFANLMAFKVPWNRENRPGIHEYNGDLYYKPEYLKAVKVEDAIVPRFEISATVPFFMRAGNASCVGGGGTAGFRVATQWQWTVEVGGCSIAPQSTQKLERRLPDFFNGSAVDPPFDKPLDPISEFSGRRPEGLSGVLRPGAQAADTQHTSTHESRQHSVLGVHDSIRNDRAIVIHRWRS